MTQTQHHTPTAPADLARAADMMQQINRLRTN